ncbi:MAG: MutT-like (Nudix) hydrolase [Anaerocolumna sp.]|jgi:8-oxo-dGTP diphosphatase|nr:MutT-like (Nudix) hydrolase [Anaerocolumna sp.]
MKIINKKLSIKIIDGETYMVEINLYKNMHPNYNLVFVDIVAKHNDAWVLCKEKNRNTWECPGGHIEIGETPLQAAKRELGEETGATNFTIEPIGYYGAKGSDGINTSVEEVFGQIFYADIKDFDRLPDYEIDKIEFFHELPINWTYPYAHPLFIDLVETYINK